MLKISVVGSTVIATLLDIVIFTVTVIFQVTIIIDKILNIAHPYSKEVRALYLKYACTQVLRVEFPFLNRAHTSL